ncbi:MAG TPA: methyltransferase MtaB domain-containing protein [Ignavibacteriaceae bacterium]|nr:methyltransferase MtaB domain-containing protein [Ignavibacteriaceae bacterium]
MTFDKLTIAEPGDLIFGRAPKPLKFRRGFEIGSGQVFPEINFTLPQMIIDESSWQEVKQIYKDIIEEVCKRAVDLYTPALVVEFELLPPMTMNPDWGAEITGILAAKLEEFYKKYGLKSALRVTPVDIRDNDRPPLMRSGIMVGNMFKSFELCAQAGADILSIESTGGKEVHDEALVNADLQAIVFALGILAVNDMQFLWDKIVTIADRYNVIPGGDTACGFANTAMVLADKGMIPRTLAAVVRIASIVRSLQAYRQGAVGPGKDCAYEGPFIKIITGTPISMEGKSSACAHLSCLGNISSAYADLWSNESVQNIKLLSTYAPVVSVEQLIYDCRLMNIALKEGNASAIKYRDWMIKSDAFLDPQAYIFQPDIIFAVAQKIVDAASPYKMVLSAVGETLKILDHAISENALKINDTELRWIDILAMQFETLPADEGILIDSMKYSQYADKYLPEEYGIQ